MPAYTGLSIARWTAGKRKTPDTLRSGAIKCLGGLGRCQLVSVIPLPIT